MLKLARKGQTGLSTDSEFQDFNEVASIHLGDQETRGLFAPLSNLGPRERSDSTPKISDLASKLEKDWSSQLEPTGNSHQIAGRVAQLADEFAFAKPEDMQPLLSSGFRDILASHSALKSRDLAYMFSQSLHRISRELGATVYGAKFDAISVNDRRLRTPDNPTGAIASEFISAYGNEAAARKGFDTAIGAAAIIRQATAKVYEKMTAEEKKEFIDHIFAMSRFALDSD